MNGNNKKCILTVIHTNVRSKIAEHYVLRSVIVCMSSYVISCRKKKNDIRQLTYDSIPSSSWFQYDWSLAWIYKCRFAWKNSYLLVDYIINIPFLIQLESTLFRSNNSNNFVWTIQLNNPWWNVGTSCLLLVKNISDEWLNSTYKLTNCHTLALSR